MKCFGVVKEDMQEVGTREDEVYGESAVVTTDGKADRIRRSRI